MMLATSAQTISLACDLRKHVIECDRTVPPNLHQTILLHAGSAVRDLLLEIGCAAHAVDASDPECAAVKLVLAGGCDLHGGHAGGLAGDGDVVHLQVAEDLGDEGQGEEKDSLVDMHCCYC
jgi:hypothetical protein